MNDAEVSVNYLAVLAHIVVFSASRGFLYGSQFCYLVASMMMSREDGRRGLFGPFNNQSSKLVLIGASHRYIGCLELLLECKKLLLASKKL